MARLVRKTICSEVWEGNGILALKRYEPAIHRLREEGGDVDSEWVWGFKRFGKCAEEVALLFEALALREGCGRIVAVPPSKPEDQPTELQKLFGMEIERTRQVEYRKWRHGTPLAVDYEESYTVAVMPKCHILLVDDVCTTGTVLGHFADRLRREGHEVLCACVGLANRVEAKRVGFLAVFEKKPEPLTTEDAWIRQLLESASRDELSIAMER